MDRRGFLGAAAAVTAATVGAGAAPARTRIERVGIQLYTVRRELAADPDGTLARVAAIGFREVEFAGYPSGGPAAVKALVERHGLAAPSAHVGFASARVPEAWARVLSDAAAVGHRYVVVASVPSSARASLEDWRRIAADFNRAGEAARSAGLQFCYHNHAFEFEPLEGRVPFDFLLEETDPGLVRVELDLYWTVRGGRDPLDFFVRWPGRFPLVHVKDMDATPRRFFADLGQGTIDFPRILGRSAQAGIRHYFYEQDETPGPPFESAERAYRYLRALAV